MDAKKKVLIATVLAAIAYGLLEDRAYRYAKKRQGHAIDDAEFPGQIRPMG